MFSRQLAHMNIDELKANPQNPRSMSKHDANSLANGMREFGDLSPIVFNQRTQQLVGGHQRINVLRQMLSGDKQIVITQSLDQPDDVGTVALGYVIYEGRQFAYRVVDWPYERELAANLLANRAQGEWDDELLADAIASLDEQLRDVSGFTNKELDKLLQLSSEPESDNDGDDNERITFSLPSDQVTMVMQALNEAKMHIGKPTEFSDEVNGEALVYIARQFLATQAQGGDSGADFA